MLLRGKNTANQEIRSLFKETGVNQKDVASYLGYHPNHLSRALNKPLPKQAHDKVVTAIKQLQKERVM